MVDHLSPRQHHNTTLHINACHTFPPPDSHTAVLVLDTNILLDHLDTLLQHLLRLRADLARALLRVVVFVPYIVLSELDRQKNDVCDGWLGLLGIGTA